VAVADKSESQGTRVVDEITALGGEAIFVPTDVTVEQQCEEMASTAESRLGPIGVLVTAAGVLTAGSMLPAGGGQSQVHQPFTNVVDLSLSDWHTVMGVNLTGTMLCARAAARRMLVNAEGAKSIVMISSGAGTRPIPGRAEYCVSKAGVMMLTRVLARELSQHNIRVNSVAPGWTLTPMTSGLFGASSSGEVPDHIPLRRYAMPEDIANVVVFLTTEKSSYMTGDVIFVDGGLVAR